MVWEVKTANEFMRTKLVTLTPKTPVMDGVAKLFRDNISGAPVTEAGANYLGVFSEKCCMNALDDAVERSSQSRLHIPTVDEFMVSSLITLTPKIDVFEAIDQILARHISGAPVLNDQGEFLGIFSEKTAMRVLIAAAYDQLPGTSVDAYMNTDDRRIIHKNDTLLEIAHKFQQTPYRRLPVLENKKLIGQVSRRDVIKCEHQLATELTDNMTEQKFVDDYMDRNARTVTTSDDLLNIAQIFLSTPYRRLPVVESGRLLGQISRRDLLAAAADILRPKAKARRGAETLYLSPLNDTAPPSWS
ncbi:CBS domain-containing protein [Aporhodopirellula aestuarii]|uniref:CBS domain-containing protein n=1 Tax=Aporhodopirellula aestuarii TaxID=2950107 RepID=A0ABT0UB00_9BACT|nr:CBS domain-containing protein [Aporhodopirellula aestuarii]MCM2374152.1 CBS domain-containing protein [Aporhodopirellula aestuarii]